MRKAALVALAVLMFAVATGDAQARHRPDPCRKKGTTTSRQTKEIRVYSDDLGSYYACSRKNRHRVLLYDDDGEYDTGIVAAIAGRYVAYESSSLPTCKEACPPGVNGSASTAVVNVRTGKQRSLASSGVDRLVLAPSGAVAWVLPSTAAGGGKELWVWDAAGRRLLDSGNVAAASLRLSGGTVSWTKDGQPYSAPVS
jgi:hypothetical protein